MIQSHLKGNAWYKVHSILQFLKSLGHNCLTFELYSAELEFPWSPSLFTRLPLLGVSISRQKFAMSAASSLGVYKEAMHKCIQEIFFFLWTQFKQHSLLSTHFEYLGSTFYHEGNGLAELG